MILKRKAYLSRDVSKTWSDRYSYSVSWTDDWRWSRDWANGWFLNALRFYSIFYSIQSKG